MWLNNHKFLEINPHLSPYTHLSSTNNINEFDNNEPFIIDNALAPYDVYAGVAEVDVDHNVTENTRITYGDLMVKLSELARTVQNDQNKCASVMAAIDSMITHHRNDQTFNLNFVVIG